MYLVPVLEYTCWVLLRHWVISWKFCQVSFMAPKLLWNGFPLPRIFRSPLPLCLTHPLKLKFFQSTSPNYSVFWNLNIAEYGHICIGIMGIFLWSKRFWAILELPPLKIFSCMSMVTLYRTKRKKMMNTQTKWLAHTTGG